MWAELSQELDTYYLYSELLSNYWNLNGLNGFKYFKYNTIKSLYIYLTVRAKTEVYATESE